MAFTGAAVLRREWAKAECGRQKWSLTAFDWGRPAARWARFLALEQI